MGSKKKHRKKQKISQAKPPAAVVGSPPSATEAPARAVITAPQSVSPSEAAHLHLIRHDVRRVTLLAAVFIGLQIALWYAFGNTGLGSAVYNLIKL